ncbi:hypothetical protein KKG72_04310 [bacterium]|nr:hypothetical protein [bacterium]MBU1994339.1 hypothetical protein [bacterium]
MKFLLMGLMLVSFISADEIQRIEEIKKLENIEKKYKKILETKDIEINNLKTTLENQKQMLILNEETCEKPNKFPKLIMKDGYEIQFSEDKDMRIQEAQIVQR